MEHYPSWEANRRSARQEARRFTTEVTTSQHRLSILILMNTVHTPWQDLRSIFKISYFLTQRSFTVYNQCTVVTPYLNVGGVIFLLQMAKQHCVKK
jgi:hypothetical protein